LDSSALEFPSKSYERDLTQDQVRAAIPYGAWLAEHEVARATVQ
jgi:hypothetical protein